MMEGVVQRLAASGLAACTPMMTLEALNLESAAADAPAVPRSHRSAAAAPAAVAVQPGQPGQRGRSLARLPRRNGALTPASFWAEAAAEDEAAEANGGGATRSRGRSPTLLQVSLVRQARSWDCGIACVQMVLRYLGADPRVSADELVALAGTSSVWTVDLAWLLARTAPPGTKCLLCTTALGAADTHAELDM
jgi:hypothetical protein